MNRSYAHSADSPHPSGFTVTINGQPVSANPGATVAAVLTGAGSACRISVTGEPRGPLCGMGICMECRATVDGVPHTRTCQTPAKAGMEIVTE